MADAAILTEQIPPYVTKKRVIGIPFTRENAVEMAKRAVEAKALAANARKPEAQQAVKAQDNRETTGFALTRARAIQKIIDKVLKELAECSDAKEQQAKAMALDRLYGTWADLTGFERRGVSRGTKRRTSNPLSDLHDAPPDQ